ncbi:MAG: pentapeptide repeat-containing protein [Cyanobacteria bacterium SBLK]|nr:pentapeptide repeat-containing protein [Cyanobacteria bacterium SBLK]
MADEEQLRILRRGVKEWNEWRDENRGVRVDLIEANLSNADLYNANLSHANLSHAKLRSANLSHANLSQAKLRSANLSHANLFNANLSQAKLSHANLFNANLSQAKLRSAKLSFADLETANLSRADLSRADLINANLRLTNLREVKIDEKTKLIKKWHLVWEILNHPPINRDLSRIDLSGADLNNINLSNVNLSFTDLNNANLSNVNLSFTDLSSADLSSTDLSSADLSYANLRKVKINEQTRLDKKWRLVWEILNESPTNRDLSGADISNANFSFANLSDIDFSYATLSNINLTQTQALYTNFKGATLTGACIEDWNINRYTNLDGVNCDYIYLSATYRNNKPTYTDRRPHDPDRNFAPGEFAQIFQRVHETLDLYFKDGVDWQAAAYSFQQIATTDGTPLNIKGIEQTGDGVIIKVDVPESLDKGKVEGGFWKGYEMAQKAFEGERRSTERHLESQERQINQLMAIVENTRTINITGNTIQGSAYAENLHGSAYTEGDNTTNAGE